MLGASGGFAPWSPHRPSVVIPDSSVVQKQNENPVYRRNVYNFVKRHSELIAIFLKKLEKNREFVIQIIQSLSVYDFISDEQKITTDIIWVRGYVMMFICKDLQT